MRLTEFQRKLAEENHQLIYSFLHKRGLSIEDHYGAAATGLCKAAAAFDDDKSAFSTFAFVCMSSEVFQSMRREQAVKRSAVCVSLDAPISNEEDFVLADIIPGESNLEENVCFDVVLRENAKLLSDKDKHIVALKVQGKTQAGIAETLALSQSYVSRRIRKSAKVLCGV